MKRIAFVVYGLGRKINVNLMRLQGIILAQEKHRLSNLMIMRSSPGEFSHPRWYALITLQDVDIRSMLKHEY